MLNLKKIDFFKITHTSDHIHTSPNFVLKELFSKTHFKRKITIERISTNGNSFVIYIVKDKWQNTLQLQDRGGLLSTGPATNIYITCVAQNP